jgi:hypothetical protein
MTASDLLDDVRDDNETALSRLGSSKALYAITGGEMEGDAVLTAAADRTHAASETFAAWVAEESDEDAAEFYDAVAQEEAAHYEQVLGELDDHDPESVPPIQEQLRAADDTAARLGVLLGHALVAGKLAEQFTGFFVGDAAPQTASLFRGYGNDLDDRREHALELLTDEDSETAASAAGDAIQAAYDAYTERLEEMGVNPKPVC